MATNPHSPDTLAEVIATIPEDALPEGITLEAAKDVPKPSDAEIICAVMGEDTV
jgi:hypothetical protein